MNLDTAYTLYFKLRLDPQTSANLGSSEHCQDLHFDIYRQEFSMAPLMFTLVDVGS